MADLITHGLKIHLVGSQSELLAQNLGVAIFPLEVSDIALFIVSAKNGIIRADSDSWLVARELYIPSLVVITDLSADNETDFEDMTLIAGKILDPVVTPYLVLHSEDGSPVALIGVQDELIRDYTSGQCEVGPSEPEHHEVIAEFRSEYLEALEAAGEGAFENALLYPALPWIPESNLGLVEISMIINQIPVTR